MKTSIPFIGLMLVLLFGPTLINAQCNNYAIMSHVERIPNEVNYSIGDIKEISKLNTGKLIVKIDTSKHYYKGIELLKTSNPRYSYCIRQTEPGKDSIYVINLNTQKPILVNAGIYMELFALSNCLVSYVRNSAKECSASVFNFTTEKNSLYTFKVSRYDFYHFALLGYDDNQIFIKTGDIKYERKRYKAGTILTIGSDGVRIDRLGSKKNERDFFRVPNSNFYSNIFSIEQYNESAIEKDCHKERRVSCAIKYKSTVVDSVQFIDLRMHSRGLPNAILSEDQLILTCGENYKAKDNNISFRKYIKEQLVAQWNESTWSDSIPLLNTASFSIYNIGDVLYLKTYCDADNQFGLKLINDSFHTLNDILLDEKSTSYTVILAFDLNNNSFLGYPKIEFVSKD